jgi:hypothetical protein
MVRKIIYSQAPTQPATPIQPIAQPRERSELGAKLAAALTLGTIAATIAAIVVTLIALVIPTAKTINAAITILAISILVGIGTFSAFAWSWTVKVAARDWHVDDTERTRQHAREDEEHEARIAALEATRETAIAGDADEILEDLDLIVKAILVRHFNDQKTTRDACIEAGICTASEWNTASNAFSIVGWRRGRKIDPGISFTEAWYHWQEHTKFDKGHIWGIKPGGQWKRIE